MSRRCFVVPVMAALFFAIATTVWAWSPLAIVEDPLVRMPGTQPGQGVVLTGPQNEPDACLNCHGENEQNAAGETLVAGAFWHGSMMGQAARDPLFWAAMTVAAQDSIWGLGNPNAVDICERCHFPEGWLGGRSDPPNASAMTGSDFDGVHCDVCHSMWDPFYEDSFSGDRESADWEGYWDEAGNLGPGTGSAIQQAAENTYNVDATQAGNIELMRSAPFYSQDRPLYPTYTENGGGQYFMDPTTGPQRKRGPFADILTDDHPDFLYSRYHKSKFFCSTCHDVSNPALANLGLSGLADNSADPGNPDQISEQHSAHKYFHVERTFSEFMLSDYGQGTGAATNPEFQVAQTGNAVVTHAARCQDCHMPDVTGKGADSAAVPLRPDESTAHPDSGAPLHNLQGGNAWITTILSSLHPDGPNYDPVNEALLVTPGAESLTVDLAAGASILNGDAQGRLAAAADRALEQLQLAATLKNVQYDPVRGDLTVRIQNNTGHKLISGFPEGRRMFLNVKAYNTEGQVIYEVNPYDQAAGTLKGLDVEYDGQGDLPDPAALGQNEVYNDALVYEMKPTSTLTGETKTFHFALATGRYKDNRIPPKGFRIAEAEERQLVPVWAGAKDPDLFTAEEYAGGYDEISLDLVPGADRVEATLYYQTTSREYIEFLRDEINGYEGSSNVPTLVGAGAGGDAPYLIQADPFFDQLRAWGDTIWQLWTHNMNVTTAAPYEMTTATAHNFSPITVEVTAEPGSPELSGEEVVFTADALGGSGSYEYRFFVKAPGDATATQVQPYSTANTFDWTTPATTGIYSIGVQVRTVGSTAPVEAQKWISYTVIPPASGVTLTADPVSPRLSGVSVTFTGQAFGGTGNYEYRFFVKAPGDATATQMQPYSTANTFDWTTPATTGTYSIGVQVRTLGSTAAVEAQKWIGYTVVSAATGATISADPASPRLAGTAVTFTGEGSGGSGSYEYRFFVKGPEDATATQVQAYSTANTFDWTTPATTGTYSIGVQVRTVGSTAPVEAQKWIGYTVVSAATGATISADPASPRLAGVPVTFTGQGSGGSGSYEYRFFVKASGDATATQVQPYSTNNTFDWTTPATTGIYSIGVQVRTLGSTAAVEAQKWMGYTVVSAATGATISADPASPQLSGVPVTFTGQGNGGSGSYEYRFFVKAPGDATATQMQPYSTDNTFDWTTPAATGTYFIGVQVRTLGSTASVEAQKWIAFSVQ